MANFRVGDLIKFRYPSEERHSYISSMKNPTVLVLHPSAPRRNKLLNQIDPGPYVHGIVMDNRLNANQQLMLRMMASPAEQLKHYFNLQKRDPNLAAQFDLAMATSIDMVASPDDFYPRVIQPMLRAAQLRTFQPAVTPEGRPDWPVPPNQYYSPYRIYIPSKMQGTMTIRRLAQEQARPEQLPTVTDTPDNERVLNRPNVFDKFRNKFEFARGPRFNLRLPVFEKFRNKNRK